MAKLFFHYLMILLHEHKIDGAYYQQEGEYVIPMQVLSLKKYVGDNCEHSEADALLYNFELHKGERAAVALKAYAVGWNLATVFEESDAPRKGYYANQRPMR